MKTKQKERFHWRSLVSFVLTLSFVMMSWSGIVLYLAPPGEEARSTGWQFWQLGRDGWIAQHLTSSTVFLLFALIHIYLNWQPMWSYLHSKAIKGLRRRWELAIAVLLVVIVIIATIWNLPPTSYLLNGSRHLRHYLQESRQREHQYNKDFETENHSSRRQRRGR